MANKGRALQILAVLFLAALAIRLVPPLTSGFLVNYDSIYHARIGQIVADTGFVPAEDYTMGGRPHLYPPLYHLILGYLSLATGVEALTLVKFVLPFASALLVFPVFFLMKKFRNERIALWAAAYTAVNAMLISQAYDSPQVFGLLLFPLIIYFFLKGNYFPAGGLFAVCALFNYGIALTIGVSLAAFSAIKWAKISLKPQKERFKEKEFLVVTGLIIAIGLGLASPWLLIAASKAGECFDPSTAVAPIGSAGLFYLTVMLPVVAFFGIWFLYELRGKSDDYSLFFRAALGIGLIGFAIALAFPQLHPYDMLLLFGFALPFAAAEIDPKRIYKIGAVLMLLAFTVFTITQVRPPLSNGELSAAYWVKMNVAEGTILANPEMSGVINAITMSPRVQTEFDLFLECVPDRARWAESYEALTTSDASRAREIISKYGIDFIVVGPRDSWHYRFNTEKFGSMGYEKVFTLGDVIIYKVSKEA